jgi:hypothetical protein
LSHSYDKKKRPKRNKKSAKKKSCRSYPHKGHAYKKAEAKSKWNDDSEEDKENEPPVL